MEPMNYLEELAVRIRAEVPPDALPDEDTDLLFLIYAVLARAKGEAVVAADVHDAWVAWMTSRGETHESMRDFDQLEGDVKAEDSPFVAAIRRAVGG